MVADLWPGAGPLGGILTALGASSFEWNLIVGCDLPFLTREWIEWIVSRALNSSAQAVVPESQRGIEPLSAMYRKNCAPALAAAFGRGVRRVSEALGEVVFDPVTGEEWHALDSVAALFQNVNTPDDFAEAQRRIAMTL
jgi:molybdopterin-guanine dinucleotide biosynthesis protein A